MFSNKDFEKLWFLYRTEGEPKNISIETFCSKNGIPYAQFNTWYRNTHKHIAPVSIIGSPEIPSDQPAAGISLSLRLSNGMEISQEHLNYTGLKELVEKLEVLC
ncbi:MAG: hypothetical protein LKI39_11645 [Bacteroides sp.]|jgi:hypothetical protein|nr:hypothetical protein [Bacteroides sp.]